MKIVIKQNNKIIKSFNNVLEFHIEAEGYCEETYYHLVLQQKILEEVKRVIIEDIDPGTIIVYN